MNSGDKPSWVVVFNPRAGNNSRRKERRLKAHLERADIQYDWIAEKDPERSQHAIREFARKGARHYLAVGGDGTNNFTINVLAELDVFDKLTYALLPWGTGNDWAVNLKLSKDIRRLVSSIHADRCKVVPLGRVEWHDARKPRLFTNTLGIGFDAFVVNRMAASGKIGKVSYLLEILRGLGHYESQNIQWSMDLEEMKQNIFSLHVGLGPTTGGGLKITPHAVNRKGRLAYTVINDAPKRHYLRGLPKLLIGNIESLAFVKTGFTDSFTVPQQQMEVLVEVDGEICGKAPFTIKIHEATLNLLDTSEVI